MAELWAAKDAVNRKFRELHGTAGGANRKLKEMWARDQSAVNRKIFSNAITWTYNFYHTSNSDYSVEHGGVTDEWSVWLYTPARSGNRMEGGYHYVFEQPVLMRSGTIITMQTYLNSWRTCSYSVAVNSDEILSTSMNNGDNLKTTEYELPSDIAVTLITCGLEIPSDPRGPNYAYMKVTINIPGIDEFMLNNSCTSDQ